MAKVGILREKTKNRHINDSADRHEIWCDDAYCPYESYPIRLLAIKFLNI